MSRLLHHPCLRSNQSLGEWTCLSALQPNNYNEWVLQSLIETIPWWRSKPCRHRKSGLDIYCNTAEQHSSSSSSALILNTHFTKANGWDFDHNQHCLHSHATTSATSSRSTLWWLYKHGRIHWYWHICWKYSKTLNNLLPQKYSFRSIQKHKERRVLETSI